MLPDAIDRRTALPRPLRVMMVSAELAPFARAGALGDVIQGLSRALGSMGVEVVVATPLYGLTNLDQVGQLDPWPRPLWVRVGGDVRQVGVKEGKATGDVRVLFLDCPPLFRRDGIYGLDGQLFADNDLRFAVLSAASLQAAERLWDGPPDVLHAHDWHTALAVAFARLSADESWRSAASVFTFHNLAFQGSYPIQRANVLGLPDSVLHEDALQQGEYLNFLKAGIVYADRVTTVSPTYAREAITPPQGCGMETILETRSHHLTGITNGIDTQTWGPSRDRTLAARYDAHDVTGREACRLALAAELGLTSQREGPIVGVVSRLTHQKGLDLLAEVLPTLVSEGYHFAVVAFGDDALENTFREYARRWPSQVAFRPVFGDPIARRVYAGADMLVMPSRFEPCGLGQQYAMLYGAVPVVSSVGGLADTVEAVDERTGEGTGFQFQGPTADALLEALRRAGRAWQDKSLWSRLVRNCMARDGSWDASARQYFALYRELVGAPPRPSLPPPAPVANPNG